MYPKAPKVAVCFNLYLSHWKSIRNPSLDEVKLTLISRNHLDAPSVSCSKWEINMQGGGVLVNSHLDGVKILLSIEGGAEWVQGRKRAHSISQEFLETFFPT